jgi:hypothetical protein
MFTRELCAAFFLPPSIEDPVLLIDRIGVENVRLDPHSVGAGVTQLAEASWAGFRCEIRVQDLDEYRVLIVVFSQREFLALVDLEHAVELERDGAITLAESFRDACQALRPPVAFVLTRPEFAENGFPSTDSYVAEQDALVLTWDSDGLVGRRFGLLYLSADYAAMIEQPVSGRDELPAGDGRLIFAGTGQHRWIG